MPDWLILLRLKFSTTRTFPEFKIWVWDYKSNIFMYILTGGETPSDIATLVFSGFEFPCLCVCWVLCSFVDIRCESRKMEMQLTGKGIRVKMPEIKSEVCSRGHSVCRSPWPREVICATARPLLPLSPLALSCVCVSVCVYVCGWTLDLNPDIANMCFCVCCACLELMGWSLDLLLSILLSLQLILEISGIILREKQLLKFKK